MTTKKRIERTCEILRLNSLGISQRQLAESCGCSRNMVQETLIRSQVAKISWPLPDDWGDDRLNQALYPERAVHSADAEQLPAKKAHPDYEHEKPCQTPHLTEDEIKKKFLEAFNTLMGGREELISNCRLAQTVLCDYKDINTELAELHREIKVVTELSRKAIHDNARVAQNQDEFNERNNGYLDRYRKAKERVSEIEDMR